MLSQGMAPPLPEKQDANTDQAQRRSRNNARHRPELFSPNCSSRNTLLGWCWHLGANSAP